MSELNEIKIDLKDTDRLKPQEFLSPTSINSWFKCPREYFYNYIAKLKISPTIDLIKGSVVHKVLELFFSEYRENPLNWITETFETEWIKIINDTPELVIEPTELSNNKTDALDMILDYYYLHQRKLDSLVKSGKAENERHAFHLTKPKFRELFVEDKELKVRGYIDRLNIDFNGVVTIGDYKTSKKFGIGLSDDYKRQLSIYSLLYKNLKCTMPDFASIIFLRYGEEFLLEITPSVLKQARDTILFVRDKTRSTDIVEYPVKEGTLCKWCAFQHYCSGEVEYREDLRKKRILDLIESESINKSSSNTNNELDTSIDTNQADSNK